jgi:hypothetical protein
MFKSRFLFLLVLIAWSDTEKLIAQVSTESKTLKTDFFMPGQFPAALSSKIDILGNRWKKAGQERITYSLNLQVKEKGQDKAEQVQLTLELPNRATLERPGNRKSGHDGEETWRSGSSAPDDDDVALLETIAFDSAESLFENVRRGAALQFLGSHFQLDSRAAGGQPSPTYDVYLASIPVRKGKLVEFSNKLFFFNSQSGLLEIVRYEGGRGAGTKGQVETRFDWQKRDQDFILRSFKRIENGLTTAELTVTSAAITSKAADGKFKP